MANFCCRPRSRPTRVPLGVTSAHPETIHRWWPVGQIVASRRLCTRSTDFARWKNGFLRMLSSYFVPPSFITWLDNASTRVLHSNSTKAPSGARMWFVADWHTSHCRGVMGRCVGRFFREELQCIRCWHSLGTCIDVRMAWRVSSKRLVSSLNTVNRTVGGRGG